MAHINFGKLEMDIISKMYKIKISVFIKFNGEYSSIYRSTLEEDETGVNVKLPVSFALLTVESEGTPMESASPRTTIKSITSPVARLLAKVIVDPEMV